MKNQFVTGSYSGEDKSIVVWFRNEKGEKRSIRVVGFEPYFYVKEGVSIPDDSRILEVEQNYTGLFGESLWKIIASDPSAVGKEYKDKKSLRDLFPKHWEADVNFINRLLTDTGIKSGFSFNTRQKNVHYEDLTPENFSLSPLVSIFDIEVKTTVRFPNPNQAFQKIIAVTVWDDKNCVYITFMLTKSTKKMQKVGNWLKVYCTSEEQLLRFVMDYFNKVKPDVISGWNVDFDVNYFTARCRYLKIPVYFDYACIFDLCQAYKFLRKSLRNRLKEMVIEEGLAEEVVSEEYHIEFWERPETREKFMLYNKMDVEYCVLVDQKYDIIQFFWDLKNFVGQGSMKNQSHGMLIDLLLLREAHGKYVLPSMPPKTEKRKSFRAAIVIEPKEGVYGDMSPWTGVVDSDVKGVAVLDMSRFYPNIVKAYYPSVLRFSPDGKENLFPEIIDDLMAKREEYETIMANSEVDSREYKNAKRNRDLVKSPLLSGIWGYIAWARSRVADNKKAGFIAGKAREGLMLAQVKSEKLGMKILYGDTDSILDLVALKDIDKLIEELNIVFTDFCKKEKIPSLLKIKLDRFYRRALWLEGKTNKKGVKKRYMGHCVVDGGKKVDFIDTKGFDMVRGDSSKITRKLQADVGDAILRKGTDGLVERIKVMVKTMKAGEFSHNEIAIVKTLHQKMDKRGKTGKIINMDYYRGSRYGNKYLGFDIVSGDSVKMLYVNSVKGFPATDVVCYLDQDKLPQLNMNYAKMVDRTIKSKVERFLRVAGLSWNEVIGIPGFEDNWKN